MRILHASHISNYTPPVGYGGIELIVDTLAKEQFAKGSVIEIVRNGVTGFVVKDLEEMMKAMKSVDKLDHLECRRDAERRFSSRAMAERYEK